MTDADPRSPIRDALRRWLVPAALALGLGARALAIFFAPQSAYLPDHLSNMGWSTYAFENGPWRIYALPANQPLVARTVDPQTGSRTNSVRLNAHACNYPPLSAYVFWLQGAVWHALDPDPMTVQPPPELTRRFGIAGPVTSRVIDTPASRLANALPGIVFDVFLAWAAAALVDALRPGRRRSLREPLAFALTLLAPPIFLDSAYWNQADSWVACLLVWCLVFLMRGRLVVAGVLYGAGLLTKPQAILLVPVLVYVFCALRFMPGGSWRRALSLWKTGAAALAVVAFVAAPFMISDAHDAANPDGALRWLKRSYLGTIGAERYDRTTLNAFNIWWLDLLARGLPPHDRAARADFFAKLLDPQQKLLGISKALLGKLLLAGGILLAGLLCARRWHWTPESWPACAFLVMLAAFVLPTSVHERYIYYCIPFLIALAAHSARWVPPLPALLLVGTLEMTSFRWAGLAELYRPDSTARGLSGFLAVLSLLSLLYSYAVLVPRATGAPPHK